MNNLHHSDPFYQLPSIMDEVEVNIQEILNPTYPQEHFIPLSRTGHNENLALHLPKSTLDRIAAEVVEGIEEDITSRKDWEDGIADAVEQLGIKIDTKIQFPFDNACGSYSPIMMQSLNEFISVAIAELLPLEGPVTELIKGEVTPELQDQADRISSFFNLFLTEICEEYYPDMKQMLVWVWIAGFCVRKTYYDNELGRPTSAFIMPQDFIVNYGTTCLKKCWRMTEILSLNKMDVWKKEQNGDFISSNISPDDGGDESNLEKIVEQVEGVENTSSDNKITYTFYECHTYLDMEHLEIDDMNGEEDSMIGTSSKKGFRPYRAVIHKKTNRLVALYRNWEEGDESYTRQDYYTKFGLVNGLGFYNFGATHLIGGLAKTCTALLRQTIDGQTLNNFPGGMRIKGMRLEDNNISIGPCEWIEVDTGGMSLRDAISPMPYKEPSPAINSLKNELEMAASRIMGAANQQIPDFTPNAPVGTTLALLDQMGLIQSTILRGLRDSMQTEFKKFYELFSKVLPEEPYHFERSGGKAYISRHDFIDQISIIPVADPHLTTKMQRIMRSQYLQDLSLKFPTLYDPYEINKMALKELKLSDSQIDKVLPSPESIPPLDPISEVMNLMQGKPVKAYIQQDHAAHRVVIQTLLNNPNTLPQVAAAALALDAEHAAFEFQLQMQSMIGIQLPPDPKDLPANVQNQIAMLAAQAIMQQQQQAQGNTPPPLLDPALVMLEKVKVEDKAVDQRESSSKREAQTKAFEAQLDYEAKMEALKIKEKELELKAEKGNI